MSDKFTELGIPPAEITPSVSIAVSGLLEHIEQLNKTLIQTYNQLENLQNLIDTDTDPALPNRKSFLQRLMWTIQMATRLNQPSCVVVFRINDFDKFQPSYGFQAYNAAINHLARILSNNIRDTDFFARTGNHDFAAIMFFADFENAKTKAQKVCHQVAQNPLLWNGSDVNFQCNFGVHKILTSDTPDSALLSANNSLFTELEKMPTEKIDFSS